MPCGGTLQTQECTHVSEQLLADRGERGHTGNAYPLLGPVVVRPASTRTVTRIRAFQSCGGESGPVLPLDL